MNKSVTTNTELVNFIRSKISEEHFDKPVTMSFRPKTGWKYEVNIPVTEILDETDVIWISNAFSDEQSQLTLQQLISKLLECENNKQVIAEVYGYNGERCDQFIYSYLNLSEDVDIIETNNVIYFCININEISTYPITY